MSHIKQILSIILISGCLNLLQLSNAGCEQLDRDILLDNAPKSINPQTSRDLVRILKPQFDVLNRMLQREIGSFLSSHGEQNEHHIDDILKLIKSFQVSWPKLNAAELMANMFFQPDKPKKALSLFNSLDEKHYCTYKSYLALTTIYRVLIGDEHTLDNGNLLKSLLVSILKKHGLTCRAGYMTKFKSIYLDEQTHQEIDSFINGEFLDNLLGKTRNGYTVLKARDTFGKLKSSVPYIHERLAELSDLKDWIPKSKDEFLEQSIIQRGGWTFDKEFNHLIQLCQVYIKSMADIFYPAKLDLTLNVSDISEINPTKDEKFMDTWTKFHICSVFVSTDTLLYEYLFNQDYKTHLSGFKDSLYYTR